MEIKQCDYNELAADYDDARNLPDEYVEYWTKQLMKYGKVKDSDVILDIGCGTGQYSNSFRKAENRTIIGLDSSNEMLKQAHLKNKSSKNHLILARCEQLPIKNDKLNFAFMVLVVHHITVNDRKGVYFNVYQALKPGGRFMIMTRSHEQIRNSLIGVFPGVVEIDVKRMPDIVQVENEMVDTGFSNVESFDIPHYTQYRSRKDFLKKVENKYISTLTMFEDSDFQKRLSVFKERIKERFGDAEKLYDPLRFTLIIGEK